ncbi:DUF5131 family protein [Desulfovibrio gilichinskyi]|uniref:Protein gp37 n=1 Tax=Desulfovibrio gilichinskyi TaxID=1519643 RepID=A0A1X7CHX2_9BACT|nr:phage Gp37/Gp68 family protein [Desulfovibrio gilichinskyi]SME96857.1 protein gp37 [Desulfovibrio gilichinskyi]
MALTKIEWTEASWNPMTGCSKISAGCKNCYAERMALRLQAMGSDNYSNGFDLTMHKHVLLKPFEWKKPQMIFVNSMSDIFHENAPFEFIKSIFATMHMANWHTYQLLTKRSGRLKQLATKLSWANNIWMGVTVESAEYKHRIDNLRETPAKTKFLSLEPLLGPIGELNLDGIDWVIVGGESGPNSRPMEEAWVLDIKNQCLAQKTHFFFKQWGGKNKKKTGRKLEGTTWDQMPTPVSI